MTGRIGVLQGRRVAGSEIAPAAVRLEERDASGYERRASAATPACGRGGIKHLALVDITAWILARRHTYPTVAAAAKTALFAAAHQTVATD
jgi:hypothetical protein